MERVMDNAVSAPVLIPAKPGEGEGQATFLGGLDRMMQVRRFTDYDLDMNTKHGEQTWKAVKPDDRRRLLGIIALLRALKEEDPLAVEQACSQLADTDNPLVQAVVRAASQRFRSYPYDELSHALSEELTGVRLVLWRTPSYELLPALYCPDVVSALYIRALLETAGGVGLSVCPACGQPFVRRRPDQFYCSMKHRETFRRRRWRKANPEKVREQGRRQRAGDKRRKKSKPRRKPKRR